MNKIFDFYQPPTDKLQKRISIVIEHVPKKSYDVFCAFLLTILQSENINKILILFSSLITFSLIHLSPQYKICQVGKDLKVANFKLHFDFCKVPFSVYSWCQLKLHQNKKILMHLYIFPFSRTIFRKFTKRRLKNLQQQL